MSVFQASAAVIVNVGWRVKSGPLYEVVVFRFIGTSTSDTLAIA
jgi:hypothetical protein